MASNIPAEGRLVLAGALTIQSVEAVRAQLLVMSDQPVIEIDCSAATEVDLSFVQLILAARVSAQQMGRIVTLAQPAAGALRDTLRRGGFIGPDAGQERSDQAFWLKPAGI